MQASWHAHYVIVCGSYFFISASLWIEMLNGPIWTKIRFQSKSLRTRPGVSSYPPGWKISLYNSKISIEQNFKSLDTVDINETIILKPEMVQK